MIYKIFFEWDEQCELRISELYNLRDLVERSMALGEYGASISEMLVVWTCLGSDLRQRKRYNKKTLQFSYDIILD
jgi:hypothetical protein